MRLGRKLCLVACSCFLATSVRAQAPEKGRIIVLGSAVIDVMPDTAVLSASVSAVARTPAEAMDKVSEVAKKIVATVKTPGKPPIVVRTDGLNVRENRKNIWDPVTKQNKSETEGFIASNSVTIRTTALAQVGELVRDVLAQGTVSIQNINFEVSDPATAREEAQKAAVTYAMRSAAAMAAAAGKKLGGLVKISSPPRSDVGSDRGEADLGVRSARPIVQNVPIEIGSVRISATVDTEWLLE